MNWSRTVVAVAALLVLVGPVGSQRIGRADDAQARLPLAAWDRVSGGLTVEFDPAPLTRIAVGEEVWVDLNPAPAPEESPQVP